MQKEFERVYSKIKAYHYDNVLGYLAHVNIYAILFRVYSTQFQYLRPRNTTKIVGAHSILILHRSDLGGDLDCRGQPQLNLTMPQG